MRATRGLLSLALLTPAFSGQTPQPQYATATPLPVDRQADSYAVYSQLLPSNVIEWSEVPRTHWLLRATTDALPLGTSCTSGGMMNPHTSVRAPADRKADLAELLADYDAHCHERYELRADGFQVRLPVQVLSEAEQQRYVRSVAGYLPPSNDIMRAPATPQEFNGAQGLHSFTAVSFNHAHTLAMVEIGMYCGGLCGNWRWTVLERTPRGWAILPWASAVAFS